MDTPDSSAVKQATNTLRLISSRSAPVKTQVVVEKADREPISYRFDVIRDDIGRITTIIMTPVSE